MINTFVPGGASSPTSTPPIFPPGTKIGEAVVLDNEDVAPTNPPFTFIKKVTPLANVVQEGAEPQILRGYIRRTQPSPTNPGSLARLQFMFNPEVIQRSYISYLDQQALDPTNSTFGSGNLMAAPGILDFSFELFFDRQPEVALTSERPGVPQDVIRRGVMVDYDYFDRVVRGVEPGQKVGNVPDNGVMLINPNNITVVFSPQMSVTGRPYNANVRFEKFSHRMVPTRVSITIQMKVSFIGPTIPSLDFSDTSVQSVYKATVPYEDTVEVKVNSLQNVEDLVFETTTTTTDPAQGGTGAATITGDPNAPIIPITSGATGVPSGQLTAETVAKLILSVTPLRGIRAAIMLAISFRESSFNSTAHNTNINTNDNSYGLFQINMLGSLGPDRRRKFGFAADGSEDARLLIPSEAVRCMYILSSNGNDFSPWVIDVNTGRATVAGYDLKFLDQAKQIINSLGGG